MTEQIDAQGRWILTHELCEACGCPSWDAFPAGVVAQRWTCQRCGYVQAPVPRDPVFRRLKRGVTGAHALIEPHREDARDQVEEA